MKHLVAAASIIKHIYGMYTFKLFCSRISKFLSQIETAWNQGNRELAYKHSKTAKRWGIGGITYGVIFIAVATVIVVVCTGIAF